ncbi:MAG: hypothetical protein ACYC6L_02010 [Anaerolineae bacterium]
MLIKIAALAIPSIVSAALLYLGTMVMGQLTPSLASSLNAQITNISQRSAQAHLPGRDAIVENVVQRVADSNHKDSTVGAGTADTQAAPGQGQLASGTEITSTAVVTKVSIAELARNADKYEEHVVSVSGLATSLKGKLLLNDGTGQILVEVDDDQLNLTALNGKVVTVVAEFDGEASAQVLKLKARSLSYDSQTIILEENDSLKNDIADDDDDSAEFDEADDDDIDDEENDAEDANEQDDDQGEAQVEEGEQTGESD